jgi:hypothetical protein
MELLSTLILGNSLIDLAIQDKRHAEAAAEVRVDDWRKGVELDRVCPKGGSPKSFADPRADKGVVKHANLGARYRAGSVPTFNFRSALWNSGACVSLVPLSLAPTIRRQELLAAFSNPCNAPREGNNSQWLG